MAMDNCDFCAFYEYDDEEECYFCSVNLDEDEMYRFVSGDMKGCPYFQNGDEYRVVRKQI